ncbi:MAG: HEPN domain-containing protein [Nanoarchaeota archaeon]|nr:HEPN domain-containing protein [Nanoarchaeota archaeon]MBU1945947.1 HEPN domain-containing protein [Nanoarchaeota archaeon]
MAQIDNHLRWCLNNPNRLKRVKPDKELAQMHLKKSEYNSEVMRLLENSKKYDWALNVGFYAIYHCFLALLANYGYESKNQSCTVTVLLKLIEENKLDFDKDLILQFDTLDVKKETESPTIRQSRETSTYGIKTEINTGQLARLKELAIKIQKETIKVLS